MAKETGIDHISEEDALEFEQAFGQIALGACEMARIKGFHQNWNDGEKLALIHSEVTEVLEAIREEKVDYDHVYEELADVVIRVMDFAAHTENRRRTIYSGGRLLAQAIWAKMKKNAKRPHKHGRRF